MWLARMAGFLCRFGVHEEHYYREGDGICRHCDKQNPNIRR